MWGFTNMVMARFTCGSATVREMHGLISVPSWLMLSMCAMMASIADASALKRAWPSLTLFSVSPINCSIFAPRPALRAGRALPARPQQTPFPCSPGVLLQPLH